MTELAHEWCSCTVFSVASSRVWQWLTDLNHYIITKFLPISFQLSFSLLHLLHFSSCRLHKISDTPRSTAHRNKDVYIHISADLPLFRYYWQFDWCRRTVTWLKFALCLRNWGLPCGWMCQTHWFVNIQVSWLQPVNWNCLLSIAHLDLKELGTML